MTELQSGAHLAAESRMFAEEISTDRSFPSRVATDLASSPPVVAVTSLAPDHLDWHGDVETYVADKLSATTQPGAVLSVADATSPLLAAHAGRLDRQRQPVGCCAGVGPQSPVVVEHAWLL